MGSKKEFNNEEPLKTHFNPSKENLFSGNQKPYESVKKFIQEFDKNIFREDEKKLQMGHITIKKSSTWRKLFIC